MTLPGRSSVYKREQSVSYEKKPGKQDEERNMRNSRNRLTATLHKTGKMILKLWGKWYALINCNRNATAKRAAIPMASQGVKESAIRPPRQKRALMRETPPKKTAQGEGSLPLLLDTPSTTSQARALTPAAMENRLAAERNVK